MVIQCSLQEARRRPVPHRHVTLTLSTSHHLISFHFQHTATEALLHILHTYTYHHKKELPTRTRTAHATRKLITSRSNISINQFKPRRPNNMGNCFGSSCPEEKEKQPQSPAKPAGKELSWPKENGGGVEQEQYGRWPSVNGGGGGVVLEAARLRVFTLAELRAVTRGFKPEMVLGEGGFGRVYKGWADERTLNPAKSGAGVVVAVKKLNPESVQGLQEWQSEVDFLGRLSHPNLVKLLGYCGEDRELLLVYEFMPKGSLENHLFRRGAAFEPLSWDTRLKIALGAARGLAFLHSPDAQIIYRDFKASNILLDSDFSPKLSDFGLAKHGPAAGKSHVTTRVIGTYGYAAPEYVATGHLYVKSDVYGFGVVLLELLTGLRAHDLNRPTHQQSLVDWARPYIAGAGAGSSGRKLAGLMDARLAGQYPPKAALRAARLAHRCLCGDPKTRPSMDDVVAKLEEIESMAAAKTPKGTRDSLPPPRRSPYRSSGAKP